MGCKCLYEIFLSIVGIHSLAKIPNNVKKNNLLAIECCLKKKINETSVSFFPTNTYLLKNYIFYLPCILFYQINPWCCLFV